MEASVRHLGPCWVVLLAGLGIHWATWRCHGQSLGTQRQHEGRQKQPHANICKIHNKNHRFGGLIGAMRGSDLQATFRAGAPGKCGERVSTPPVFGRKEGWRIGREEDWRGLEDPYLGLNISMARRLSEVLLQLAGPRHLFYNVSSSLLG